MEIEPSPEKKKREAFNSTEGNQVFLIQCKAKR